MTFESDRRYLERRARQEREMAEQAADPCAYRTHAELAWQYERQLAALLAADGEAGPAAGTDHAQSERAPDRAAAATNSEPGR